MCLSATALEQKQVCMLCFQLSYFPFSGGSHWEIISQKLSLPSTTLHLEFCGGLFASKILVSVTRSVFLC